MRFLILISSLVLSISLPGCNGFERPDAQQKTPVPGQEVEYRDDTTFKRKLSQIDLIRLFNADPIPLCDKVTADELLASCPTQLERQQIRNDFNIYFDKGMVDNNKVVPWSCTEGGDESSVMLSMYNTFRLMQCIPFDTSFSWAPGHNNLYTWLKSTQHVAIGYFWAQENEYSHGWNKRVYLKGNELDAPRYRKVIDPQSGVGLIHAMILIIHEARHADINIGHNCGYRDSNLAYLGAWAVQYYLDTMLAENSGDFFSQYQKDLLSAGAHQILQTRFCDE